MFPRFSHSKEKKSPEVEQKTDRSNQKTSERKRLSEPPTMKKIKNDYQ